jgi:hypothetical protein
MKYMTIIIAVGLAFAATFPATPAIAQNARSFVSGHGNDANNCRYASPCRTFAAALALTNSGGVISVLDPAGYGAVAINKAISIVNEGVGEAGITFVGAGTGIYVSVGATESVILRGLSIDGAGLGTTGILFNGGKSLTIENCVIRHLTNDGIDFLSSANSRLLVSNTIVSNNGNGGIVVSPLGSNITVTANFNHVHTSNNVNYGIVVDGENSTGTVKATASDSIASGNGSAGYYAASTAAHSTSSLTLFKSVSSYNDIGVLSSSAIASVILAQTMVVSNRVQWQSDGNFIFTFGDNYFNDNSQILGGSQSIARQ